MRAEFTPDNHYAGLLTQAKALFRITQSQEAIISTLRSKLTELESQLAMVGTAEIEAQRAANEQLTNEIERMADKIAGLRNDVLEEIENRDALEKVADKLAHEIARFFNVDIGEHISANCPWGNAREAIPTGDIESLKAEWKAEAIPGFIREMGERLRTQDNRITADPLFCVFEKDYVVAEEGYGHDRIDWGDIRDEYTLIDPDSDKWHRLESLYQAGREVGDNYQRNAVKLVDKFVTAAFTEAGANDHIRMNGHNLRKPFVYVTSLFRTPEMIELREWLKAQEAAKEQQ